MYKFFIFMTLLSLPAVAIEHTVKKLETLMLISKQYYGTHQCWRQIQKTNNLETADLEVNQKLTIDEQVNCIIKGSTFWFNINGLNNWTPKKTLRARNKGSNTNEVDGAIDKTELSLSFTPIKFTKVHRETDISYIVDFVKVRNNKEFFFNYERNYFKTTDPINDINIRSGSHRLLTTFDINNLWGKFTYFALASYLRRNEGNIYFIRNRLRGGVLGIKYGFVEYGETLEDLSLSLIPLYEHLEEMVESGSVANTVYTPTTSRFLRSSFRFRVKLNFPSINLKFQNTTFYRPAYNIDRSKFEFNNMDFENITKFDYNLNSLITLSYRLAITYDIRQKTVHDIPSTDVQSTFLLELNKAF